MLSLALLFPLILAQDINLGVIDESNFELNAVPTLPIAKSWYKCPLVTTVFNESKPIQRRHTMQGPLIEDEDTWLEAQINLPAEAECAKYKAPLCYKGICDSKQTIELFVKRIPATKLAKKSVFIMDGGPGAASCDMEDLQQRTWTAMRGEVDVYISDPRGTGRSEMLKCPSNSNAKLPECLTYLNKVYGNNAGGFSLTSAATDIVALAKSISKKSDWFLYGVSYGTLLAARSMHIGNAFKGYILDSVTPERWEDVETSFNEVALRYIKACENDKFCSSQTKKPLVPKVKAIYKSYDNTKDTSSQVQRCRSWLRVQMSLRKEEPTSFGLKKLFAWFIRSQSKQRLFPPLLIRLARCNDDDWKIFNGAFTKFLDSDELEDNILFPYDSRQLNHLIEASEIMEVASYNESIAYFKSQLITLPDYDDLIPFCYYHNSKFKECKELNLPSVKSFVYKKDKFHDKFATIPKGSSVLIMSGEYDPITPDGWAEAQYDGLEGDEKVFYNLKNVGHSVVDTPCGFNIYKQYLKHNGDLEKINPKCLKSIPKLPFNVPKKLSQEIFGVDNIYDGIGTPTTTSPKTTTKLPTTTGSKTTTKLPTTTGSKTTTKLPTTTGSKTTTKLPTTTGSKTTTKLPTTTGSRTTTRAPATTKCSEELGVTDLH